MNKAEASSRQSGREESETEETLGTWRPKPLPGTPEYRALGACIYFLLDEPLVFDPRAPARFLEDLNWRYQVMIKQKSGPVPITQLLSTSEIQEVKEIVTAVEGAQQHLNEIWAKKERDDRARGGRKSARRFGIEAWVVSQVYASSPPPSARTVWKELENRPSDQPDEVSGSDGDQYEIYRDHKDLIQKRDSDGKTQTIRFDTFYKRYYLPSRKALRRLSPARTGE